MCVNHTRISHQKLLELDMHLGTIYIRKESKDEITEKLRPAHSSEGHFHSCGLGELSKLPLPTSHVIESWQA